MAEKQLRKMINALQVEGLSKSYGDLVLFSNISFAVEQGERVGIIGRNGCGKSTLMNIIAGREDHDGGSIVMPREERVAYLVQNPVYPEGTTVLEACFMGDAPQLQAVADYRKALLSENGELLHTAMERMELLHAWECETRAKQILTQLNITHFDLLTDTLSGGQIKRVALANALIVEPDLLVLDEPTNHLDLDSIVWLEEYLASTNISLLLVTHDRYFLDRVCTRILEIDENGMYGYKGNYTYYVEKRQQREDMEAARNESDRNRYRRELEWMRQTPQARSSKARYRIDSFHQLEEQLRTKSSGGQVRLDVKASYIGKKIFEVRKLSKRYGQKVILDQFDYIFNRGEHLGIAGDNGTGKSTFLKMLLGEVEPDSGVVDVGSTVRFGYYSQQGMDFDEGMKVIDVVTDIAEQVSLGDGRSMSASQFLQYFLFPPAVQHSFVARLSGGERRRLYLCTILMRSPNFLVLDEPTNDLDIATLQVLEEYLQGFEGCVIVVSHDRCFMDHVADHLLAFQGDGEVKEFPSVYSDYIVWRDLKREQERKEAAQKQNPTVRNERQRDRSNRMSYAERKEFERIESELPELESEKSRLEEELSSGTLSADDLNVKSLRIGELLTQIDTLTERWLELSEKES